VKDILYYADIALGIIFALITILFIIGAIAPFKLKMERRPGTASSRRKVIIAAASTGIVAVTAIGVLSAGALTHSSSSAPTGQHQSHASGISAAESSIAFLRPQNGDHVKQCPAIEGSGQIPASKGLWIIVVPDSAERPRQYWIESQAKMDGPDHWSTIDPVSIDAPGSNGIDAYIYAVLIDKKWSRYFAASTAGGNFSAQYLPPTETAVAGPVTVTRVAEPGGQSCHSTNT
jgi:hypothetical protein